MRKICFETQKLLTTVRIQAWDPAFWFELSPLASIGLQPSLTPHSYGRQPAYGAATDQSRKCSGRQLIWNGEGC